MNQTFNCTLINSIKLNPEKSEHLRITLKSDYILEMTYFINGIKIKTVSQHKHFGIIYNKMSFNKHFDYVVSKASKKFGFLKQSALYKSYILSILEYSNVCVILNKFQTLLLEKVQKNN